MMRQKPMQHPVPSASEELLSGICLRIRQKLNNPGVGICTFTDGGAENSETNEKQGETEGKTDVYEKNENDSGAWQVPAMIIIIIKICAVRQEYDGNFVRNQICPLRSFHRLCIMILLINQNI